MTTNILNILDPNSHQLIPDRDPNAVTGSVFIKNNMNLTGPIRDQNILKEFLAGNIPNFLRTFVPIDISDGTNQITYLTMSDVLSIGNDDDYVRMPMSAPVAKIIADKYNCTLPTKKMVIDIWNKSHKVAPIPHGPPYDASMLTTDRFNWSNNVINKYLNDNNIAKNELISGHKKDVVIDKNLLSYKDKVGIFGWVQLNGIAIQGPEPNCISHDINYYDYSHSIRLIAQNVLVNNVPALFNDILKDDKLSKLVSEQGSYDGASIYAP